MGLEIERKFLMASEEWRGLVSKSSAIKQGYLNSNPERTVRVRIIGNKGILTVKGKNVDTTRLEYEYEIPQKEALELLLLCEKPIIEKVRNEVNYEGNLWEIDEFEGDNKGLILAEVELEHADQEVDIPVWIGQEVSGDQRYYNSSLIKSPFKDW